MGAAAVAGGAVYVSLPPIEGLTEESYLAVGTMPNGEPVPTIELDTDRVWRTLVTEERRIDLLCDRVTGLREWRDEIRWVMRHLAPRIGRDVPSWPEDVR